MWAAGITSALLSGLLIAPAATAAVAPVPEDVATKALPTVQIDSGVVWDQVVVGSTVYVGGEFKNARPAGAQAGKLLTPRGNVLAYDLHTGELIESFAPMVNGPVKSIEASPDGSRIYLGGTFSGVNGVTRWNVAAVDAKTGDVVMSWKPAVGGSYVNAIVAHGDAVYLGGLFTQVAGNARKNTAAVTTTGALTSWAPVVNGQIDDMVVTVADQLVIAGRFGLVNGTALRGFAALKLSDGTAVRWAANSEIQNGGRDEKAGIWSLATDGTNVYGTGWGFNGLASGDLEGTFAANARSGNVTWTEDCKGDTYGVYSDSSRVYTAGHAHDCSTLGGFSEGRAPAGSGSSVYSLAFSAEAKGKLGKMSGLGYLNRQGKPAPDLYEWYPNWLVGTYTGMGQAAWDVTGTADYVLYAGEFQAVNGKTQQGLVRMVRPDFVPPTELTASFTSSMHRSTLVVDAKASTAIAGNTVVSYTWDFGDGAVGEGMTATHEYARPGTYEVTLAITDNLGSAANTTKTIEIAGPPHAYVASVEDDGAAHFWRLGESSGSNVADSVGSSPLSVSSVTWGADGAIDGESDTAASFNGRVPSLATMTSTETPLAEFSVEAWFKTTTKLGGKILGYENSTGLSSSAVDRGLMMDTSGKVSFGVYNNGFNIISTTTGLNDGKWHHAVGTLGPDGMVFYVDGQVVDRKPAVTSAQMFQGYWHIGGGTTDQRWAKVNNWNIVAEIDEVAVYPTALNAEQISRHYAAAHDPELVPPTAQFETAVVDNTVTVDASASVASGSKAIASYAWDFGDGSAGEGVSVSQDYVQGGTYTIVLTVTDSAGQQSTVTRTVVVGNYPQVVMGDGAAHFWRLGESSGSNVADSVGSSPLSVGAVKWGSQGAIAGEGDTAASFNGSVPSLASTTSRVTPSETLSVEAWFKTTTKLGGKILGFENTTNLSSTAYDRHLMMDTSGKVSFGVYNGMSNIIMSPVALNDGKWHHAVGTLGPDGMVFYVDGQVVDRKPAVTSAQMFQGYWHIGGGATNSGWAKVNNWNIVAEIDEVAVYPTALNAEQIATHFGYGVNG